jgi:hypothetical protein
MKNLKEEIQLFLAEKLIAWAVCLAPSNDEGGRLRGRSLTLKVGDMIDLKGGFGFVTKIKDIVYFSGFTRYYFYDNKGCYTYKDIDIIKKVKS